MKKNLLAIGCFAFSFLFCLSVQAQVTSTTPSPNSVIPPSPTAASLGKYGSIPVSAYTGIPNINVPVYTIQSGSLTLPLSLSYHASGIRVSEEASWVGLGWSLFSGGAVTRSIRGLDDFNEMAGAGYPDYVFPLTIGENNEYVPASSAPWTELLFLRDINAGFQDPEPDIFYYNFDGHSGKFTIAQRANSQGPYQFNIESQEKIKIDLYQDGTDKYWIFTTIDGKQYQFKTPEKSKTYSHASSSGEPSPDLISANSEPIARTSTWYLDKITAPDGNTIDFEYTAPSATGMVPCASRSESRAHLLYTDINPNSNCDPESPSPHTYYISHNVVFDVYLKKIRFSNGQIVFETSARIDIKPASTTSLPQKLDKIRIYKKNGESFEEIRSVDFSYDYFTNSDPYLNYSTSFFYNYTYSKTYSSKRLKLLSVTEKSGTSEMPPTRFEYITTNYAYGDIPDKYTKSQDHWGYFNSGWNIWVPDQFTTGGYVSTLLPSYADQVRNVFYNGADKTPDEVQMQLGTLNKIIYPTGGSTELRYGINEYGNFPPEYVTVPYYEQAVACGEDVDPELEPMFWDLEIPPATFQFTLPQQTTVNVSFTVSYSYLWDCETNPWGGEGSMTIHSTGSTPPFFAPIGGNLFCAGASTVNQTIVIPAGTYEVIANATFKVISQATVSWNVLTPSPLLSKQGGGLRVESVIDYDGLDHNKDIVTEYKYTHKVDGVEKSSGVLMSPLFYEYEYTTRRSMNCGTGSGVIWNSTYLNRSSESVAPLGSSAQGKTIGYSSVTVLHGVNGVNGKTVYTYKNEPERYLNQFIPSLPGTPNPANGLLTSQVDYKYNPDISIEDPFQKVKALTREYVNETNARKVTKGLKCHGCELIQEAQENSFPLIPFVLFYDNVSEWWHLSLETITQYSGNDESKFVTSSTEYFYENPEHLQPTKTISTVSDGKITTVLKYPLDYTNITASDEISSGITDLQYNHILYPVIEKAVYRSEVNGSNTRLANAVFTAYDGKNPIKVFETEISTPITNFVPSAVQGGAVVKDARFAPRIIYDHYGDQGNIMQLHKSGDFNLSYLWDVTNIYPTAEVKNAAVDDIAYTSFELNDSRVFWQYSGTTYNSSAVTGKQSYSLAGGSVTRGALSASKKYIVSYWSTSADSYSIAGTQGNVIRGATINGWTCFTHIVTGQNEIAILGAGSIDELRLYPEGAQMTTFTYDPLIGMTSQCDANNGITYYEYDNLGRLSIISDQDRNVIKKMEYKYRLQ